MKKETFLGFFLFFKITKKAKAMLVKKFIKADIV